MAFTATPQDGSSPTPIPMSSAVPDGTNTPLAIEGGPSVTTGGNTLVPVSMYVKDGNDIAQGFSTDAANANSVIGQLKQIKTNTTLGQAAMAASLPVTMANNQSAVSTVQPCIVSTLNSSVATLTANSVFTGTSESSLNFSSLSVEVFANVASAASGLSVQQSQDGTNWDVADTFSVLASTAFNTTVNLIAQFFRVVYTNGATNQTTFRLQIIKQPVDVVLPRTLTVLGNLKTSLQEVNGTALSLGQAAMAASLPVTLASNQPTQNVAISPSNTGLPANLATIVQSTNNKSSGSVASLVKAFTSNVTAGNTLIVVCAVGNGTAPTISDTLANSYTLVAPVANGTALNVAIFFAAPTAAGANTVTVNNGGTTASIAMEIYEVSGLLALKTAQPDVTATSTGNSATAATSAISSNYPNEYAFVGVGIGTAAQTITAGAGWTNDSGQQNPTTPAGLFSFISMSQFLEDTGAVTPQATFTSEPWAITVATFTPVTLGVNGTVKLTDGTVTMAFGQNTMANSIPVTMANNQSNVPTQDIEQSGYVAATSPPSTTNAGSDTSYTFSSQVSRVIIQNNTSVTVNYAFDTASTLGSLRLLPGAMLVYPKKVTALHLFTAAAQNINGSAVGNIVVLGAL